MTTFCRSACLILCLLLVSVAGMAQSGIGAPICVAPSITSQPVATSVVCPGTGVNATVVATGTGLSYQWYKGVNALNTQTTATLVLNNLEPGDTDGYSVRVTGTCGSVLSDPFNLTVTTPVTITGNPVATSVVCPGSSISVSGSASGTGPIGYQWYKHISAITGQNSPTLTLTNLQPSETDGYTLIASGSCNFVLTSVFNLTVTTPLTITSQPVATSVVCPGSTVTAAVSVTGTGPYMYEWIKGINIIGSQNTSTLLLTNVQAGDTDGYTARITGTCNNVLSTPFNLTVATSPDLPMLTDLYNSTGGASWTNKTGWLDGCSPCGWYGVQCDVNGRVERIELPNNNLVGTIPSSLSSVTTLHYLNLGSNLLTGSVPSSLGSLSNLQYLYLNDNQLSSDIPSSLSAISGLKELYLNNNQLSGSIPAGLGNLTSLEKIQLNANLLTGCFPLSLVGICGATVKNFGKNPGLPGGGDFDAFCNSRVGSDPAQLGISISSYLTVVPGNDVTLTASGGTSYTWATGETTDEITVRPLTTATYSLTGGTPGCIGTASITVYTAPLSVTLASNVESLCVGSELSLSALAGYALPDCPGAPALPNGGPAPEPSTPTFTYTWAAPAGVTLSSTSTSVVSASLAANLSGVQTLTVTVSDGYSSVTTTKDIFVVGTPIASISGNLTLGNGGNTILTASATDGYAPYAYKWSNEQTSNAITVTTTGTYSVTVTNNNDYIGCSSTTSVVVSEVSAPFAITAVSLVSCTPISQNRKVVSFIPYYSGLNGSPVSFSVTNEMLPTTTPAPYSVQLYLDNSTITLQAEQSGVTSSFSYNWLEACNSGVTIPPPVNNTVPRIVYQIANQTAVEGQFFGLSLAGAFTDSETPSALTLTASGLPAGLNLVGTTISGTPSTSGTSMVTITATDPGSLMASMIFNINVSPAISGTATVPFSIAGVQTISCSSIHGGKIGIGFLPQYIGLNGQTITFRAINEMVPTTNAGPYSLQLYIDNPVITLEAIQSGITSNYTYDWLAACANGSNPVNTAPRVANVVGSQTAVVDQFYSVNLAGVFTDTETPNSLTLTASGLPSGLNLVGTVVSGTPSTTGTSTVTLTATDPGSLSVSTSFQLTVNAASVGAFIITGVQTVNCVVVSPGLRTVTFTPQYAGINGQPITFVAVNEMVPTTNSGPYTLNLYTDNPAITLKASQAGTSGEVSYVYNWLSSCTNNSRLAAEGSEGLRVRVLGNPVMGSHATVEVSGAQGELLRLSVVNGTGVSVGEEVRSEAGLLERVEMPVGRGPGMYLLRVSTPGQTQTIKLIRP